MSKKYASEVVNKAKSFIGCKESDGSHRKIIDIYNDHLPRARDYKVRYTDEWCATFVSTISILLGYTDIMPTECSCQRMIDLYKAKGLFIEDESRTPKPGWLIFYDWQDSGNGDNKGWSDHVGIVEKVSSGKIITIEGNLSNQVKRNTLQVNGKYIRGFAVPAYDEEIIFFKRYTGRSCSIVDGLNAIGEKSSFEARKKIAAANGIKNFKGAAAQNTDLLNRLKAGNLIKP